VCTAFMRDGADYRSAVIKFPMSNVDGAGLEIMVFVPTEQQLASYSRCIHVVDSTSYCRLSV